MLLRSIVLVGDVGAITSLLNSAHIGEQERQNTSDKMK